MQRAKQHTEGGRLNSQELIERLRRRDQRAYEEIIGEYSRLLWAVAGRHLAKSAGFSTEDVEECVSEAFFRFWQHPERFDPEKASLKTYLCTITKNLAIDLFRKRSGTVAASFDDALAQTFAQPPEEPIDYQELYEALADLPEPSREILARRYFYEQKPAAIAEAMGIPKKEVENRLYRAKKTLFVLLSDDQEDRR